MGGKEGARGYLYQALIAVFEALEDDRWQRVYLEYESKNDKVDIAFSDEENNIKVIQVKSSINNFSINNIDKWLIELIEDKNNAINYNLILVGNCDNKTNIHIKSINKLSKENKDNESEEVYKKLPEIIKDNINKITVKLMNNDFRNFEKSIESDINKLLYNNDLVVTPIQLELIVKSLLYQFNKFSTNAQFISKGEFENKIIEWADYNYELKDIQTTIKYFDIMYYLKNEFKKESINLRFVDEEIIKALEEVDKDIEDIYFEVINTKLIKVEETINNEILTANKPYLDCIQPIKFNLFPFKKVTIDNNIIENIKRFFEVRKMQIDDSFFCIGELKEDGISGFNSKLIGTNEEKKKYILLKNLNILIDRKISQRKQLEYYQYIKEFKILPLCIRNISKRFMEDIEVKIKIPKSIELLTYKNIKIPNRNVIEDVGHMLISNLRAKEDSNVKAFEGTRVEKSLNVTTTIPMIYDFGNQRDVKKDKFIRQIKKLFDYKIFNNEEEYVVLSCEFKELKANDNMMFPSHLLVKSEETFNIEYSITCKNMSEIQYGEIKS